MMNRELDILHRRIEALDRQIRSLRVAKERTTFGGGVRQSALGGTPPSSIGSPIGSETLWTNNSGGARSLGEVVVADTSATRRATTTATADNDDVIGCVAAAAAAGADMRVRHQGFMASIPVTGATAIGDWLTTSTTAGSAVSTGARRTKGAFAVALTSTAGAGTVDAYLVPALTSPLGPVSIDSASERAHDVLQRTLGNAVIRLRSEATNDDPESEASHGRAATTDATVTTLHTTTIPASTTVHLLAHVTARRTGGVAGTAEDGAAYVVAAAIKNVAGTATIIGAVGAIFTAEDQAAWDATIDVTGATARVRVTGAVDNNVTWHAEVWARKVSS